MRFGSVLRDGPLPAVAISRGCEAAEKRRRSANCRKDRTSAAKAGNVILALTA